MKLELPRLFGDDPYGWFAMAEEFLEYYEVEPHHRVAVAGMHLGGDAALWLHWHKVRYGYSSWAQFTEMLLQHFGPGDSMDFNMALSHIAKSGSVEEYVALFIKLSCRAPNWSDAQLMRVLIGGLKEDL